MGAYVEATDDEFDFDTDWQEIIGAEGPGEITLSSDAQEATLVGYIPWNKIRSAARYFLGFAYTDTTAPWLLHRENPAPHPALPWLFCYDVNFRPIGPIGNPDGTPANVVNFTSPFYPPARTGNYDSAIATVKYKSFRMNFLLDDEIATPQDEWQRNTWIDADPRIEALSADGVSQLVWQESSATGPTAANPIPAPISILQSKTGFVINWKNVPLEYLSKNDNNFFYPSKILNCVGTVHNGGGPPETSTTMFLGIFPNQTVFMQPPKFNIHPAPVASATLEFPLLYVDIVLTFDYFDPILGAASPLAAGFQTFPWRGDGMYYYAAYQSGATVTPYLEETDFNQIWTNINLP